MHASKVCHGSPRTQVADLTNCLLHLRIGHGPAQVERPVHRRTQFVRPKLDQPRQRTLAHGARLCILWDLIVFAGARGRGDSGDRRPRDVENCFLRAVKKAMLAVGVFTLAMMSGCLPMAAPMARAKVMVVFHLFSMHLRPSQGQKVD